ncbi:MAG: hypothetical protein HY855_08575 [Burkholderiales bacterium]|nr:hypothetical protein [Burkholderiales bacterium]
MPHPYAHLASLLAAWFHQDFDLAGPTAEAVAEAYRRATRADEVARAAQDIERFLHDHAGLPPAQLGARFDSLFEPEVDPLGFAPSVEAFLRAVQRVLQAPPAPPSR